MFVTRATELPSSTFYTSVLRSSPRDTTSLRQGLSWIWVISTSALSSQTAWANTIAYPLPLTAAVWGRNTVVGRTYLRDTVYRRSLLCSGVPGFELRGKSHILQKFKEMCLFCKLTLTYLLTYSTVQSPSWEANWFAASQEIPRISRNPKVHYRTHKHTPRDWFTFVNTGTNCLFQFSFAYKPCVYEYQFLLPYGWMNF